MGSLDDLNKLSQQAAACDADRKTREMASELIAKLIKNGKLRDQLVNSQSELNGWGRGPFPSNNVAKTAIFDVIDKFSEEIMSMAKLTLDAEIRELITESAMKRAIVTTSILPFEVK